MCFFDLGAVPRFEIRFCIRTPDFTVICQNWGDHCVENFIRKVWRQFAEICVFSKTEKGTKTRFEEEAKGNSEMAYCLVL